MKNTIKKLVLLASVGLLSVNVFAGDKGNGTNLEVLNRAIHDDLMSRTEAISEETLDSIVYQYGENTKNVLLLPVMKYFTDKNTKFDELSYYKSELMKVKKDLLLSIKVTPIIYGKCEKTADIMCTSNKPFTILSSIIIDKEKILNYRPKVYTDVLSFNKVVASILHEYTHHFMSDYDDKNNYAFTRGMLKVLKNKHFNKRTFEANELIVEIGKGVFAFPIYYDQTDAIRRGYVGGHSAWNLCLSKGYKNVSKHIKRPLDINDLEEITGVRANAYVYNYDPENNEIYNLEYLSRGYDLILTSVTCEDFNYNSNVLEHEVEIPVGK